MNIIDDAISSYPTLSIMLLFSVVVCLALSSSSFRSVLWSTLDWKMVRDYCRFVRVIQVLLFMAVVDEVLAFLVSPSNGYLLGYVIISVLAIFVLHPSKNLLTHLSELQNHSETPNLVE